MLSSSNNTSPEWLNPLLEYILKHCSSASKIVEVGVGRLPYVARELKKRIPSAKLLIVDLDGAALEAAKRIYNLDVARDDVTKPTVELYQGAELIYAVRVPPELWPHLVRLARLIGSKLAILPLHSDLEAIPEGLKPVTAGKACLLVSNFSKRH